MKQVIREHRWMLILLLLLAVIAGSVWLYLLVFQQHQRDDLYRQWTAKRHQLHDMRDGVNAGGYQHNQEALKKLLATVPTRSELPRILGQITDYAAMRKAAIETLSYKPIPLEVSGLQGYTLVVSVKGSYEALKQMLADLRELTSLAYPESVSFVNPDPQSDQIVMEIRMVLTFRSEGTK